MTSNIQIFAFEDNLVRIVMIDDEPWFVGKDACRTLAIRNTSDALNRLDDDEKSYTSVEITSDKARARNTQNMAIISEPGLYRLIFSSRKPEAERLKHWLAHEVLPSLRKNGSYSMNHGDHCKQSMDKKPRSQTEDRHAIALVREYRLTFGNANARNLWAKTGLPNVF